MSFRLAGPLLLVGAGKMGGALLAGWLREGLDPKSILIRDPEPSPDVATLIARHDIATGAAIKPELPPSVILLAVKPQIVNEVLTGVAPMMGKDTVLLSIAAGRTLSNLAQRLPTGAPVVRAMPNTPAAIGRGMSVACANDAVTRDQALRCTMLLEGVGEVIWIDDEEMMDAVTAISGSGPAYVFLFAECLANAGIEAGLDPDLAMRLARATISGAGELLRVSTASPSALRENVTSPQGVTAAALEVLRAKGGFKELLARAVESAAKRSRELSA
jgi:pyrroline-5-carboxylate reductase